jgi:hypothetical protein
LCCGTQQNTPTKQICFVERVPDDPIKDVPAHPLQALKPKETINILPDIAKLTPAQLAKLQAEIKKGM